jgi:hypothetical protein
MSVWVISHSKQSNNFHHVSRSYMTSVLDSCVIQNMHISSSIFDSLKHILDKRIVYDEIISSIHPPTTSTNMMKVVGLFRVWNYSHTHVSPVRVMYLIPVTQLS